MDSSARNNLLRSLPQVQELLHHPCLEGVASSLPHHAAADAARDAVDAARRGILEGSLSAVDVDAIAADACLRAHRFHRASLRRVVNASGVVIHTNLGRSVLARDAVKAAAEVAGSYSTLEYDTATMARGSRHDHCEQLLRTLTGAEAAIAVNNNAAAVMMVLWEFARDREAVVSRGQLVEIGGSFRIPDIMELSGAAMVEVGTTNKTHRDDYARAIGPRTAMLLKVHPSNYRQIGFTESVDARTLRALADAENARRTESGDGSGKVLVYEDLGSGALVKMEALGSEAEPTVAESLAAGCDLVSFSGDKMLGGPQAGIIVGSADLIGRLKRNPLARALRLDKMTLAALEATLRLYLDEQRAYAEIPTLSMLTATPADLEARADALAEALRAALPEGVAKVAVVDEIARAGGGALPMCDIPTKAVQVDFLAGDALSCNRALVRRRDVPIVGRLKKDALLFDVRTLVDEAETDEIAQAVAAYFRGVAR